MRRRVVVTDHPFEDTGPERAVAEGRGADFAEFAVLTEADTAAAVSGAAVVLVDRAPVTADVIAVLPDGAVVIRYGVGYDNVDVRAASRAGVHVCHITDYGTNTVADHAATLLLACLRRLTQFDDAVRGAGWSQAQAFGTINSFGTTCVGLVGTGRIGVALIHRLRGFGFRLIAHDPYVDPDITQSLGVELVDLPTLLARADAISLHLPLTEQTRHLVDSDFLGSMRRGASLINTSRGGLVDTVALAAALRDGRIAAAGLDVYEIEPLNADSPLRGLPNVILTPHVAFYSEQSLVKLQRLAADELGRALDGRPLKGVVSA
ncbi:C-terminal binding protein [Angustibacter sp. McL0619]|uniref:C-terminal binding protein n=1 Tax=Angustibacter sp. McL0619 TaxID=3415676 RepID=UPI003CF89990